MSRTMRLVVLAAARSVALVPGGALLRARHGARQHGQHSFVAAQHRSGVRLASTAAGGDLARLTDEVAKQGAAVRALKDAGGDVGDEVARLMALKEALEAAGGPPAKPPKKKKATKAGGGGAAAADAGPMELPTNKNNDRLLRIRHSCSHVMAMAVQKLHPEAQVTIGPWIDDGFYYDFAFPDGTGLSDEDLAPIQKEMRSIVKKRLPFRKEDVTREEAKQRIEAINEPCVCSAVSLLLPRPTRRTHLRPPPALSQVQARGAGEHPGRRHHHLPLGRRVVGPVRRAAR